MTVYGYARVSTQGQTLAGQGAQLAEAGAVKVFLEKISGVSAGNRKALARRWRRAMGYEARSASMRP